MTPGSLGVVVLTYGSEPRHLPLFERLRRDGIDPRQVVVVHNPADPMEHDPEVPEGCALLRNPRNSGYTGGMNRGIEEQLARGADPILLLTDDVRPAPGAIEALCDSLEGERYGVLGPVMRLPDGGVFSRGGVSHRRSGGLEHRTSPPAVARGPVMECDWVDGGAALVPAEVFRRVGLLEERFWSYCEDADLGLRARRAGYRVGVVEAAAVEQSPGGGSRPGVWAYLSTRNGLEYARRAAGALGLLAYGLITARHAAFSALLWVAYRSRLRSGDLAAARALTIGYLLGLRDFLRGRWGPPPEHLPGMGDVRNA